MEGSREPAPRLREEKVTRLLVAVLDNFDSFTFNLVQVLGSLGAEVTVHRNDAVTVEEIEKARPDRILISPGPKRPQDAGVSNDVIRHFSGKIPILGVCLGHQCIAQVFGAKVQRAERILHGKESPVYHDGTGIFRGLPSPMRAMRYHSLLVDPKTLPPEFILTAKTLHDEVMGIRHRDHPVEGVQFHPESYRTPHGRTLLKNFLSA